MSSVSHSWADAAGGDGAELGVCSSGRPLAALGEVRPLGNWGAGLWSAASRRTWLAWLASPVQVSADSVLRSPWLGRQRQPCAQP